MEEQRKELLGDSSPAFPDPPRGRSTGSTVTLAALSVVAITAISAYYSTHTPDQSRPTSAAIGNLASARSTQVLDVSFGNEYGKQDGWRAYPFLKNAHLVEPFRKTTVSVKPGGGLQRGRELTSCTVVAEAATTGRPASPYDDISGVEGLSTFGATVALRRDDAHGDGKEAPFHGVLHFPQPSTFSATVTCELGEGEDAVQVVQTEKVECLYVRRELRRMTDRDRNDWFDVLVELYKISQAEAQQRYGPAASSMHQLIAAHLDLVLYDMRLDHLHGGLGFLTHHTALSARAEFALQAVNPRLSMPYWDFTIDSQMVDKMHVRTLQDSIIFTKDWFGELNTEEHTVTEGRWAYLEVPKREAQDEGAGQNPYGLLRGPWNLNESPYVTRFHTSCGSPHKFAVPSCGAHLKLVTDYDSWNDVGEEIKQNDFHDGAHLYTGGVGGECTEIRSGIVELLGENVTEALLQIMPATMQWLYRAHLQKPPDSCSPGGSCRYTCSENTTAGTLLVAELFDHFGWDEEMTAWKSNPKSGEAFKAIFCQTKSVLGDAVDAGGANDPTFWPIHPTLERLYQFKDLVQPITDRKWPTGGVTSKGVSTTEDDEIPCYSMWYSSKCASHHKYDKVAFEANMRNDEGNYVPSLPTNHALLHAMTPGTGDYRMSYIYENFLWEHCDLEGYKFPKIS